MQPFGNFYISFCFMMKNDHFKQKLLPQFPLKKQQFRLYD